VKDLRPELLFMIAISDGGMNRGITADRLWAPFPSLIRGKPSPLFLEIRVLRPVCSNSHEFTLKKCPFRFFCAGDSRQGYTWIPENEKNPCF
jgi:hypothetical protein